MQIVSKRGVFVSILVFLKQKKKKKKKVLTDELAKRVVKANTS